MQSFDFLIFGGAGDLAFRKLYPALFSRQRDGDFPHHGKIIGIDQEALSREEYVAKVNEACIKFTPPEHYDEETFNSFSRRLDYLSLDGRSAADFVRLSGYLKDSPAEVRVFYLSTPPDVFIPICNNLAYAGLIHENTRITLEKPLGLDLMSAQEINETVASLFKESQICRIDHYLGKEPVQNLLALRFGNALFEPLWSRTWISDVQITIAEQIGVEQRGKSYDSVGAIRDMLQNHLLQLLCIIGMEPPSSMDPDAVRDEKIKLLRAIVPISAQNAAKRIVRGQYGPGVINGLPVCAYLEEHGIGTESNTETFVALKAEINNWRWSGVPFYLRTGKRLQKRLAEIVVNFRSVPHSIFPWKNGTMQGNQLVIRLQPEEEIKLYLMAKAPGDDLALKRVRLNLDAGDQFECRPMDAYERLLIDVIRGRLSLFVRRDELEASWSWIQPILHGLESSDEKPIPYKAGSWGPEEAHALLSHDGAAWCNER